MLHHQGATERRQVARQPVADRHEAGVTCMQGLMPERKVFEVHIEQGHKYGAKVVLRGEAGMSELGVLPGDVIFVLEPKQHKTFKRVQNDIVMEKVGCRSSALPVCSPHAQQCETAQLVACDSVLLQLLSC